MAKGIAVNLGEIETIADKYSCGSNIMSKIDECNGKLYAVKNYYKYQNAQVYQVQKKNISEVSAAIRSITNNFEDISDDLYKYVKKMKEDSIVKEDADVFVTKEYDEVKDKFDKIDQEIAEFRVKLRNKKNKHEALAASFKLIDIEKEEDGICSIDFNKKSEVDELQKTSDDFIEAIETCLDNTLHDTLKDAEDANKEIIDWYDRDYDASDHLTQIAKFGATVTVEIGTVAAVTYLGGPAILGVAVYSGLAGTTKAINEYNNGATGVEATTAGGKTFAFNLALEGLGSAGSAASKSTKAGLESVEKKAVNTSAEVAKKNGKSLDTIGKEIEEEAGNKYENELTKYGITDKQIKEIVNDTTKGAMTDTTVEELTDYLNDEYDLNASSEAIEVLIAVYS